jgi:hypothetical protein
MCLTLDVAQPGSLNRIDYKVFIKFSSSYKLSIHINTSLQPFHPLEKSLKECLTRDGPQNELNADQKPAEIIGMISHQFFSESRKENSLMVPTRVSRVNEGPSSFQ